jgi:hypothetical protein
MSLPPADEAMLADRGIVHEVQVDGGMICVLFPGWPLPQGLSAAQADVLLRLVSGYPDVAPDMWWVDPPLHRADGSGIAGTESTESHLGRTWQRWSRHFTSGQWQSGIDGLESFLALIRSEFELAARGKAA